MPAALLARRLRSSLWCQKQVVAGDRGRSEKKYRRLTCVAFVIQWAHVTIRSSPCQNRPGDKDRH